MFEALRSGTPSAQSSEFRCVRERVRSFADVSRIGEHHVDKHVYLTRSEGSEMLIGLLISIVPFATRAVEPVTILLRCQLLVDCSGSVRIMN